MSKVRKVGILVHPFWSVKREWYNTKWYNDIISSGEYDGMLILLPHIEDDMKEEILKREKDTLYKYLLGEVENHTLDIFFPYTDTIAVKHIKKEIENKSTSFLKQNNEIFYRKDNAKRVKLEGRYRKRLKEITETENLLEGIGKFFTSYTDVVIEVEEYKNFIKFLEEDKSENYHYYTAGPIENIKNLVVGWLENALDIRPETEGVEIEVFGEFYSQCVKIVNNRLLEVGFNSKRVAEKCTLDYRHILDIDDNVTDKIFLNSEKKDKSWRG